MAVDPEEYRVPRNFKLLDELENAEKGKYVEQSSGLGEDAKFITLGLTDKETAHELIAWSASIIPHQNGHIGDRIYSLEIAAGPEYPEAPPDVKFSNQVALDCVNFRGEIQFHRLNGFRWHRERSIFELLCHIRKQFKPKSVQLACAKLPVGATY